MIILGVESSCDETAIAIVRDRDEVIASVVASQANIHAHFGGVVPEIASRLHTEVIITAIDDCLKQAELKAEDIDALAVTSGPGLVGALLVGVAAAKALASVWKKPLYPVHHIEGHIAANFVAYPNLNPPFMSLVVSGGHSSLICVKALDQYEVIGKTRDDAAGEAFDKVARILGLAYPGGPAIQKAASQADLTKISEYKFSLPKVADSALDFSFSGLKTQAVNYVHKIKTRAEKNEVAWTELLDVNAYAAAFQEAVVSILVEHSLLACQTYSVNKLCLSGGVAANSVLRHTLRQRCEQTGLEFFCPEIKYCTDNAVMIAAAAFNMYYTNKKPADNRLNANPSKLIGVYE